MSVYIIQDDVRDILPTLDAGSFDCIVTSPPYYGLRDYGTGVWDGGDLTCDHKKLSYRPDKETPGGRGGSMPMQEVVFKETCGKCGARRIDAQIGIEPTLDAYLETIVAICRELRRVLKPSGVFFLNIGDSYVGGDLGRNDTSAANLARRAAEYGTGKGIGTGPRERQHRAIPSGLKPKDLCLVPEKLGIALQTDGWWVRSKIIWHKLNPMPESVTDRPTSAHETIWMLTKNERYFWNAEAVKENALRGAAGSRFDNGKTAVHQLGRASTKERNGNVYRNMRDVWTMASHPYRGAHFATFPPELAERCIKAGCPSGGHVLDPFAGSGTTGLVADRLGRDCTLIDLNADYARMALSRIRNDAPMLTEVFNLTPRG